MKRKSRLFEDMITEENIRVSFYNAKKGKKHYQEVRMVESNPDYYLSEIKNMLQNKTFKTSEYEVFTRISGGKTREIFKLPFYPDRIIHHCIIQVIQDLWIKGLIRDTYSTIPERGIHDGVRRMKKALRDVDGTKYCLKFDISKYYPSVNHDV
ncbi:MAG: reverse transcriptase, partial [Tannerellaceae bacterium]|nr:reverse transcriptase [Tannerellaceae bacterium]